MIKESYLFLSKNFLKTSVYNDGSRPDDIAQIYDNNVNTVYSFSYLPREIVLFFTDNYGNIVSRTLDTLIIQNTNIKNLVISTANTSGVYTPFFTVSDLKESSLFLHNATKTTTSSIKISINEANNTEAYIGELRICNFIADLCALTKSNFGIECNAGDFRTANGRLIHYSDYQKWNAKIGIENLYKAEFDQLQGEIKTERELVVIPYLNFSIKDIYECYVNPEFSFSIDRKTELYDLSIEAREL